ncbi:formyltransferase family protein [Halobellus sp. GM3]|uniref:formyltransferase family protein n=1 Tax=Halobellus sp. GM3 TaxID=3458410 RepID=UPI00403E06D2
MDIVFLGINDTGREIYQWLCNRDEVRVRALLTTKEQLSLVEDIQPDAVVAAGYPYIVPEEILTIPERGCINVHPGYLPQGRGYYPNVWSIVENLPAGGTVHYMDTGIDTGDIIARKRVEKQFSDDAKSLYERIERTSVRLFKQAWPEIESGDVTATEQSDDKAIYHRKSDFKDLCQINPSETHTAREFLNVLRALTFPPHENAMLEMDGKQYTIEIDITPVGDRPS